MSIYSNDNISKIAKLTTRELPHLAKTAKITVRENNGQYCKRGNIRGTLIFADFAVFQQARIKKPAIAIFCLHILDT